MIKIYNYYTVLIITIQVIFVGEAGEDTGGLRREFWRLFIHAATQEYFIGTDCLKTFQQNIPALEVINS